MRTLWQDLRYGARTLSKKPGFTLIAVLTLALGIGVNTALFTVFDAFVLKPLPLKDPDSIVKIYGRMPDGNRYRLFSYLDYLDYRDRNHVFDGLVAFNKVAGETAPYIDNLDKLAGAIDQIQINIARTVQTHSIAGAKISSAEGRYPVLIFSPGNQMNVALYAAQIEDLASHGHIVVGMDHPYESLGVLYPDGRVARYSEENRPKQGSPNFQEEVARFYRRRVDWRAADASFVLNQLEKLDAGKTPGQFGGRLNLARVGAFGHSIGGVAAAQTCQSDRRFKACLNLDGKAKSLSFFPDADGKGPEHPFMTFEKALPEPTEKQLAEWKTTREQVERAREQMRNREAELLKTMKSGGYRVTLRGATHESFSDEPLILPFGDADAKAADRRRTQIIRAYTLAFFDQTLRNRNSNLLKSPSSDYPEVAVERFGPSQ